MVRRRKNSNRSQNASVRASFPMARPAVSESIAALKLQQSINGELSSDAHTEGKHNLPIFTIFIFYCFIGGHLVVCLFVVGRFFVQ